MKFSQRKPVFLALVAALSVTACSADGVGSDSTVRLDPGEIKIYTFPAEETIMVSFSHEGDADTALACQGERADPMAFPLPECAGVYASDGTDILRGGNYATGLHGAGVSFEPVNGEVVVALKNISRIPLDLSIEAEPID